MDVSFENICEGIVITLACEGDSRSLKCHLIVSANFQTALLVTTFIQDVFKEKGFLITGALKSDWFLYYTKKKKLSSGSIVSQ